jgi:competence protein ComEA
MHRISVAALVVLGILLAGPVMTAQQSAAEGTKSAAVSLINVNTATAVQLEALPGIGPKLAARIVEHRQKNGAFKKVEELMNVQGIGEKNFLKLKPLVTITPPKV